MLQEQESPSHYILIYNNYYLRVDFTSKVSSTTTTIATLRVTEARTENSFSMRDQVRDQ